MEIVLKNRPFRYVFFFCSLIVALAETSAFAEGYIKSPDVVKDIKRVAVLPFDSGIKELGKAVSDSLAAKLLLSDLQVIERARLEQILAEQGLTLSGVLENQQSIIGKVKNIDAIIIGTANSSYDFGSNVVSAVARMVDIKSGEVVLATSVTEKSMAKGLAALAPLVGESLAAEIITLLQNNNGNAIRSNSEDAKVNSRTRRHRD